MITDEQFENNGLDVFEISNMLDIPLIGVVRIDKNSFGKLDVVINRYYNGNMKYLKLLMDFNKISDPTEMRIGQVIELPDFEYLLQNTKINSILDDNIIPGVSISTNNFVVNSSKQKNSTNSTKTTASPKLKLTFNKVSYNNDTGMLKF